MEQKKVGIITHFYDKLSVAIILLEDTILLSDLLHIKGDQTDFEQPLISMQIHHADVKTAKKGESVGVKLIEPARAGDLVFKVV